MVATIEYTALGFPPVWVNIEGARIKNSGDLVAGYDAPGTPFVYTGEQNTSVGIDSENASAETAAFVVAGIVPATHSSDTPLALDFYVSRYSDGDSPTLATLEAVAYWLDPDDGTVHPAGSLAATPIADGNAVVTFDLLNDSPGAPIAAGAKLQITFTTKVTAGATGTAGVVVTSILLYENP